MGSVTMMFPTHSARFLLTRDDNTVVEGIYMKVVSSDEIRGTYEIAYVNWNQYTYETFEFRTTQENDLWTSRDGDKFQIRAFRNDDDTISIFKLTHVSLGKSWNFIRANAEYDVEILDAVPEYNWQQNMLE